MLVLIARYWNEIEWINTSLEYIFQWNPDKVIISEGNWSSHPAFKGREHSTDGTREILQQFAKANKDRVQLINGERVSKDYRTNQAATCRKALELSGAKPGDWFITIDCDSFISQESIDTIKILMKISGAYYFPYLINHFMWDLETCVTLRDIHGNLLPRKIHSDGDFKNANHYGIGKNYYTGNPEIHSLTLDDYNIQGYHYSGIKNKDRIEERYLLGDKLKSRPEKRGYDKKRKPFTGQHPAIVQDKLFGDKSHVAS